MNSSVCTPAAFWVTNITVGAKFLRENRASCTGSGTSDVAVSGASSEIVWCNRRTGCVAVDDGADNWLSGKLIVLQQTGSTYCSLHNYRRVLALEMSTAQ